MEELEKKGGSRNNMAVPLLIFDGDCSFCRLWIERWKSLTGERVEYEPFQEVSGRFPEIPLGDFKKSVQLVLPGGEVLAAAHAVFRVWACAPGHGGMLWAYEKIPGVAAISEAAYAFVAAHRSLFYRLTRFFWGDFFGRPSHSLTRWLFLRLLGLVYFFAFASLATQIVGLVGRQGILPAARFLQAVHDSFGSQGYWQFPTLAWLSASDAFLSALTLGGALLSLLLVVGVASVPVLFVLWVFYLSVVVAGQDFLMFQWDGLLLEAGFLAVFFAPWQLLPGFKREREPSRVVLWLLRLLAFRLMFSSGASKLLSHDSTWRNLTALNFHYETQPLPTSLGWYAHQLPPGFQKFCVVAMFFIEVGVPFLIFAPRRLRMLGAGAMIFLQALIALTGNYNYFNLLAVALLLLLLDDAFLRRLLPARLRAKFEKRESSNAPARHLLLKRGVAVLFFAVMLMANLAETPGVRLGPWLPRPVAEVLTAMRGLRVVSRYGLFAVMTTARLEIVIEGSQDGESWQAYEFNYKPGDVARRPGWVQPFQPRLDWQMWFAAFGSYAENPWFENLMVRLLQGSPEVLALFEKNPFPGAPPRYVRALRYQYHFTDLAARRATGAWWRRELKGPYFPVAALR